MESQEPVWVCPLQSLNPLPDNKILDWSKLKVFAVDNFKLDKNGRKLYKWVENRKLYKWVENTAGKGEIAHYEQFLLFPQCFQKTCTADM